MPSWLTTIFAFALGISALAGAAVGIRRCVKPIRTIIGVFNDFAGEDARPGVAARPGVVESIASIKANQESLRVEVAAVRESQDAHGAALELQNEKIDKVSHEMFPNSGLSMRDSMDRIEEFVGIVAPVPKPKAAPRRRPNRAKPVTP